MSANLKPTPANRERPGAHEVLLAGIGAASLIRKNAGAVVEDAFAIAGRVQEKASILIYELGGNGIDGLVARANSLGKRASAATGSIAADLESRLQPLLRRFDDVKIGLGITVIRPKARRAPAKRARKPAGKTAGGKARKAA